MGHTKRLGRNGGAAFMALLLCAAPACSLFVSLDDLSDGASPGDAGGGGGSDAKGGGDSAPIDGGAEAAIEGGAADAHVTTTPSFRVLVTVDNSAAGGNNMVVTRPAQIQPGDLMIALVYGFNYNTTATAPTDWQLVDGFSDPTPSYQVFYFWKIATSSEPSTYTFVRTGNDYAEVDLFAYSGVNASNPFDDGDDITYENVTAYGIPSISTSLPNELITISAVADGQGAASWAAPAGVTPRKSSGYVFVGDKPQAAVGSVGPISITCSVSSSGGVGAAALTAQ